LRDQNSMIHGRHALPSSRHCWRHRFVYAPSLTCNSCLGPVTSTSSSSSGRVSLPFTFQSKRYDKRHKKQKISILVFSTYSESLVSMQSAGEASIRVSLSSFSPVPVTSSASYCNVNGEINSPFHQYLNLIISTAIQTFFMASHPVLRTLTQIP